MKGGGSLSQKPFTGARHSIRFAREKVAMKGFIYIAGSFKSVRRSKCGEGKGWIDNDPHFWTFPPTWGICRNDLRRRVVDGDYIFFVLPSNAEQPQSVFAYLCVSEKITHADAYRRRELRAKQMGNKNPNGNIIVDGDGSYNRFDAGVHRHIFDKVKLEYAIGDPERSRLLSEAEIGTLAPQFLEFLKNVFGGNGTKPYDLISRYGRQLSESQVRTTLDWLNANQ
jgi:hypothetical protein